MALKKERMKIMRLWISHTLLETKSAQDLYNERDKHQTFTDNVKGHALNIYAKNESKDNQARLHTVNEKGEVTDPNIRMVDAPLYENTELENETQFTSSNYHLCVGDIENGEMLAVGNIIKVLGVFGTWEVLEILNGYEIILGGLQ